jgi:uncharacterized MAPEG superfamily protein
MTTELTILAWVLVLALFQIGLAGAFRTRETGMKFNMSARDAPAPPMGLVTARLVRAQANLFETLPLFIAAILIAHVAGRENAHTTEGAWFYLTGRIVYIPLYAFGVPVLRTIAWAVALAGIVMIIDNVLGGA